MRTAASADSSPTLSLIQVGPVYGRRTMTGLLESQGLKVSQARVGESLRRTNQVCLILTLSSKTIFLIDAHRGIPNELMRRNSQVVPVDPHLLPEPDVAIQEFESFGGT